MSEATVAVRTATAAELKELVKAPRYFIVFEDKKVKPLPFSMRDVAEVHVPDAHRERVHEFAGEGLDAAVVGALHETPDTHSAFITGGAVGSHCTPFKSRPNIIGSVGTSTWPSTLSGRFGCSAAHFAPAFSSRS